MKTGKHPFIDTTRTAVFFLLTCTICLSAYFLSKVYANSISKPAYAELIIPTADEVMKQGYPVNENGESYGGVVRGAENLYSDLDLVLVENGDGIRGYVRASDMDSFIPTTPEEAAAYQPKESVLTMYLQDGCTKIGTFRSGG